MSDLASVGVLGWMSESACQHADPEVFFPAATGTVASGQAWEAKAVCAHCPVRAECLAYALATSQRYGVWGGATEKERREMTRSRHHWAASPARPGRDIRQ